MLELCHCPLCGAPHSPLNHWCPCCDGTPCEHRAALYRLDPLSESQRRAIAKRDERRAGGASRD
jgi:hypothetical protein